MGIRGQGFASLHTISEARSIILDKIRSALDVEDIAVEGALGRYLANDVFSPRDLPGFRQAAMDGFAILAKDSFGASDTRPIELSVVGTSEIGDKNVVDIVSGQALRISTGAPVPSNATGVIKIEECELFDTTVEIYSSITEGRNISDPNEDVSQGELIIEKDTLIQPWDISLLLSCGISTINVYRKPRIATFSTGNELITATSALSFGQIVDSSRPAINNWLQLLQCEVIYSSTVKDSPELIKQQLLSAAEDVDLLITTGGTSVGTKDYIGEVIDDLGELWVHGVAIRPGKPVAIGQINTGTVSVPIIALPGYPLAAFLNFHVFVSFLLSQWTGQAGILSRTTRIKLAEKVASKVGVHDFVRLRHTDDGARVIRISGASVLSSLVKADYLLEIPYDLEGHNAGELVTVYLLR